MEISLIHKKELLKNVNNKTKLEPIDLITEVLLKNKFDSKEVTTFTFISKKTTGKRYYFLNENFFQDVKQEYKKNFKLALYVLPALLIAISIFVYFEFATKLTGVLILFAFLTVIIVLASIFFVPKKLILKNKFLYEVDFLGDRKNKLEFSELEIMETSTLAFVYFTQEKSPIIFAQLKDKEKFIQIFQEYKNACKTIKGNRLQPT
ncbi:hypothetical protein FHG64_15925 [Antarcticibacterium flavum]|uniref:YcxB family protein n=1 Tax=Antarcticibacterium flavum TaxID=2058175 RepID=A0A5B7X5U5_9FLAO|nr:MULTISPECIES: hypothetical protein [Antarcticibacterium]MCM4161926.1 hypothetical protein [Antarcticibacterium sp. W02-3]QCY70757.1 hypothetical protein FHG64_15925 [Antarcticibacterium flavum]